MTNDIDVLKKALRHHDEALRLKKINEELYAHLTGSLYYLIKYSEKYQISLPEKDLLLRMVEKADYIIDRFHQPKGNTEKIHRKGDRTIFKNCLSGFMEISLYTIL